MRYSKVPGIKFVALLVVVSGELMIKHTKCAKQKAFIHPHGQKKMVKFVTYHRASGIHNWAPNRGIRKGLM